MGANFPNFIKPAGRLNNPIQMKNKNLLKILWCSALLFVIVTTYSYYYNFSQNGLSKDPEVWAQFGDYFGGILNPFISLLNLIILTYLSIRLVKDEDDRNKWTLQELARPLGSINMFKNDSSLHIELQNCGLGPMVINNFEIIQDGRLISKNFMEIVYAHENDVKYNYRFFSFSDDNAILAKDEKLTLMRIKGDKDNPIFKLFKSKIVDSLKDMTVIIYYSDMYDRKIGNVACKINFHETR